MLVCYVVVCWVMCMFHNCLMLWIGICVVRCDEIMCVGCVCCMLVLWDAPVVLMFGVHVVYVCICI